MSDTDVVEIRLGDLESQLPGNDDLVSEIGQCASAWLDARHAAQMMYECQAIPERLDTHFHRRGLIDGAIITYMRCFAVSKRRRRADVGSLLGSLTSQEREVHDAVNEWRHDHTAHRSGAQFEDVQTTLLWPGFGTGLPEIRVRLATAYKPALEDFEQRFENLAKHLGDLIWERRMFPLQQKILKRLGPKKLAEMQRTAAAMHEKDYPGPIIGIKINVGSAEPPGEMTNGPGHTEVRAGPKGRQRKG